MIIRNRNVKGFTLIELMVVSVIIAALATLGGSSYISSLERGRDAERIAELNAIAAAQEQFFGEISRYAIISSVSDGKCGTTNGTAFSNTMIVGGVIPSDPRPNLTRYYDCFYPDDGGGVLRDSGFCIDVRLERAGGNAAANCGGCNCDSPGTDCSINSGNTHFCVKNQQ